MLSPLAVVVMRLLSASRETHGNQGRADVLSSNVHFHLPLLLFFDTLKGKKQKKTVFILCQFDRRQSVTLT